MRNWICGAVPLVLASCTGLAQSDRPAVSLVPPSVDGADVYVGTVLRDMSFASVDVEVEGVRPDAVQLGPLRFGRAGFVNSAGLYGYVDEHLAVVIEPRFLWAGDFGEDRAPVRTEAGFRFIDRAGELIGPVGWMTSGPVV